LLRVELVSADVQPSEATTSKQRDEPRERETARAKYSPPSVLHRDQLQFEPSGEGGAEDERRDCQDHAPSPCLVNDYTC
jgi:hypothetical protein